MDGTRASYNRDMVRIPVCGELRHEKVRNRTAKSRNVVIAFPGDEAAVAAMCNVSEVLSDALL